MLLQNISEMTLINTVSTKLCWALSEADVECVSVGAVTDKRENRECKCLKFLITAGPSSPIRIFRAARFLSPSFLFQLGVAFLVSYI